MNLLLAAAIAASAIAPASSPARYPHAQTLVDRVVATHPGMIDAIMHVSPIGGARNIVIAAHLRQANGEDSGADDLGVARTGAPLVEVQKDGVRLGILVQLRDARHRPIGALGLMYAYKPNDDIEARVREAFATRDALAARIASTSDLVKGG